MNELRKGQKQAEDFYKSKLLELNYFKHYDGRQLYELNLSELKEIYTNLKEEKGQKDGFK